MTTPDPNVTCRVCGRPARPAWDHHVAGFANAPEVTTVLCPRCAAVADDLQRHAGIRLDHSTPRSDAETIWAVIAGLGGLLAAWFTAHTKPDATVELPPTVVAAGRLLAALGCDDNPIGPTPIARDRLLDSQRVNTAGAHVSPP